MPWGPKSMRPALNFRVYEKVPPARKVPYNPSILIPLGINMLPLPNCPVADPDLTCRPKGWWDSIIYPETTLQG